ncbi:MAG: hypothetical protein MZV70_32350 [Desulfobacterales bacterium]|nr:hypothetical protein [Desulfobacterales bacterium]
MSLRGNGHAVVLFVAAEGYNVAQRFKFGDGELGVLNFCLLHAENVRLIILQPGQNNMQAGTDGVDIVSGNLQISAKPFVSCCLYYHDP